MQDPLVSQLPHNLNGGDRSSTFCLSRLSYVGSSEIKASFLLNPFSLSIPDSRLVLSILVPSVVR